MRLFRASFQAVVLTGAWFMSASAHGQAATTASFSPERAVIGQSATFFWQGFAGSTRCTILGVPGLDGLQANSGAFTFAATQNLNASVFCSRPGGGIVPGASARARFTALDRAPPPTIVQFPSDFEVPASGPVLTIFRTTDATTCNIRGTVNRDGIGTGGAVELGSGPNLYESTITCFGPGGSTTDTQFFNVGLQRALTEGSSSSQGVVNGPMIADFSLERDLDGDRQPERIEFSAARRTLTIIFRGRDGEVETTKIFDKLTDLSSIAVKVERTQEGHREISLRPLR